ncbi:predicted protein [Histoplasma capsulatum G186AR]|uniref:Uncharacterized protein n=1 Tax=Ajellomyces capsulatus (strain G186AR / H82 / ATCC MYA-2454 / RMSCC 2432) TaxID=447093 RepID=C0P164_AJECG|nr:uncharacterized protein HCBG_09144 [Histoplasma capsulatum G186AR]EEH02579.1 predicted protein [Histoplasma capsulatum G186AR]
MNKPIRIRLGDLHGQGQFQEPRSYFSSPHRMGSARSLLSEDCVVQTVRYEPTCCRDPYAQSSSYGRASRFHLGFLAGAGSVLADTEPTAQQNNKSNQLSILNEGWERKEKEAESGPRIMNRGNVPGGCLETHLGRQ